MRPKVKTWIVDLCSSGVFPAWVAAKLIQGLGLKNV